MDKAVTVSDPAAAAAAGSGRPPFRRPTKAILIPGNGGDDETDLSEYGNWYGRLAHELRSKHGIPIVTPAFPDPLYAHEDIWKKFAIDELGLDANTLVIGHSSGAACALRLMEERAMAGCVLVAAYDTDMGDDIEKESGYFDRPFDYDAMKANCPWVLQFHAKNDPLVPVASGRLVAAALGSDYVECALEGHFQGEWHPVLGQHLARMLTQGGPGDLPAIDAA